MTVYECYLGHENTTDETGQMLTGYLDKPQKYRIMQTKAFIRFVSTKARDQRYKGFSLTYMPYGTYKLLGIYMYYLLTLISSPRKLTNNRIKRVSSKLF